ncbi:flagellar basal-body rod protein FlgB [Psychromonas ingrahamii 37]|uniref:Flagellar basal body rod protein FlgB n=1 Tax=Psychromonas ingrahamii (strain DSM 17664 / CCUG 51855 / 37) TaxID=357804 RepID=A1T0J6_PSYIN|nr:flagellar basal body rod protein FlgB [Psychromonas ingrahamii]ABM05261.1 flagellar basal-body rod protein FlgB [Psychromonas ingrahamii 37]
MSIQLDKALGIHTQLLQFHTQRTQILANNLANSDTPNYKAQDLTYSATMNKINARDTQLNLSKEIFFRIPFQRSENGNTVELGIEQAKFAENNLNYQTSLNFLKMKISGLKSAIEGR